MRLVAAARRPGRCSHILIGFLKSVLRIVVIRIIIELIDVLFVRVEGYLLVLLVEVILVAFYRMVLEPLEALLLVVINSLTAMVRQVRIVRHHPVHGSAVLRGGPALHV